MAQQDLMPDEEFEEVGEMAIDLKIVDEFLSPESGEINPDFRNTLLQIRQKLVNGESMNLEQFCEYIFAHAPANLSGG